MFCARFSSLILSRRKAVEAGVPPAFRVRNTADATAPTTPSSLAAARARDSVAAARSQSNFQSRTLKSCRESDQWMYKRRPSPQDVAVLFWGERETSAWEQSGFSGHPTRQAPAPRRSIL